MRGNAVLGQRAHVLGLRPHGENAAGDARVNRLHAAVQHLRKSGDLGDIADRNARLAQHLPVPPVEMISIPRLAQSPGELHEPGLVGDADESAFEFGHKWHIFPRDPVPANTAGVPTIDT